MAKNRSDPSDDVRRHPFSQTGRRLKLVLISTLFLLCVATLVSTAFSRSHPKISWFALTTSLHYSLDTMTDQLVDYRKLIPDVTQQILFIRMNHQKNAPDSSQLHESLKGIESGFIGAFVSALPVLQNSSKAREIFVKFISSTGGITTAAVQSALGIPPDHWHRVTSAIMARSFFMGECRIQSSKAACEIVVILSQDPKNMVQVKIISLWQRETLHWRLERILGLKALLSPNI